MSLRQMLTLAVSAAILIASSAAAQRIVPSALLTIDQNCPTVIERIVGESGDQVDSQEALRRVSELPITRWNSKAAPEVRHIGPMAQDFHALFGVGEDDVHIGTTDAQGVALAAIQGLHQMMRQKDREIAQLRRKLEAIEAKLRP